MGGARRCQRSGLRWRAASPIRARRGDEARNSRPRAGDRAARQSDICARRVLCSLSDRASSRRWQPSAASSGRSAKAAGCELRYQINLAQTGVDAAGQPTAARPAAQAGARRQAGDRSCRPQAGSGGRRGRQSERPAARARAADRRERAASASSRSFSGPAAGRPRSAATCGS